MSESPGLKQAQTNGKQESSGLRIKGLVEETKRMNEANKGSPKMAHESSVKAPTRVSNGEFALNQIYLADRAGQCASNWIEYRSVGKYPERRAFHASFVYNNW